MIPIRQIQNKINLARTLNLIWRHGAISRSDIARVLELDKSTITDAIQKLLEAQIIEEWKQGSSKPGGGRKPIFLRIREGYGVVAGIEFRPESYRVVLCNLRGTVLHSFDGTQEISPGELLPGLSTLIDEIRRKTAERKERLITIGIGLSGIVDSAKGQVVHSIPFGISSPCDLTWPLMEKHRIPVLLENDANSCAWSELGTFAEDVDSEDESGSGFLENPHSFLAVLGETPPVNQESRLYAFSVGIGICINQRIYRGPNHFAGEFRSLSWNGEPEGQFGLTRVELTDMRTSKEIRDKVFAELGSQIALLTNTLDCDAVYICGHLEHYAEEFLPILDECIRKNWSYEMYHPRDIILQTSTHGENAVASGAAALTLYALFGVPDYGTKYGNQIAKLRDLILSYLGTNTITRITE